MSDAAPSPIKEFQVDELRVLVFEDRASMGRAAAADVAQALKARIQAAGAANVIFAAAPSQNEMLDALVRDASIDWSKVRGFHMDEYLGLTPDHPASFRRYLREHCFDRLGLKDDQLNLIAGEQTDRPLRTALAYEDVLKASPTDIVLAGIGENGHLAFNDPPVADFLDPLLVKVVRLDEACRVQQVNDGCFARIEDVPTHAFTLTVPALLAAPVVSVVVPGPLKANAVRDALKGPIAEACPASALRRHAGARLYLDRDSAVHVL